jgi:hypothetical protein
MLPLWRCHLLIPLKLVDKSLKLRIRFLKGDILCEAGVVTVADDAGGRKRSEGRVDQEVCAKKQKKADDRAASAAASATIVVDLSYDELMNEKESASLATQVQHSRLRLCSYRRRRRRHQQLPPPATGHQRVRVQQALQRASSNGHSFSPRQQNACPS